MFVFQIREYRRAASLEEAWELNQKKANRIGAGMLWQRMQSKPVGVLIDLSDLGLDRIEETEEAFTFGCMATLRQLESHEGLNNYTNGAAREAVRHIIGVQFRNLATLGGSLFGRFGFSDVLTLFLAMDTYVQLYKGGTIPLREFVSMPRDRDVLVSIIVKKKEGSFAYESVRTNASTDFPVLTMAGAYLQDGTLRLAVGARPGRAMLFEPLTASDTAEDDTANGDHAVHGLKQDGRADVFSKASIESIAEWMKDQVPVGDSHRGSAAYRTRLVGVLTRRVIQKLREPEEQQV